MCQRRYTKAFAPQHSQKKSSSKIIIKYCFPAQRDDRICQSVGLTFTEFIFGLAIAAIIVRLFSPNLGYRLNGTIVKKAIHFRWGESDLFSPEMINA